MTFAGKWYARGEQSPGCKVLDIPRVISLHIDLKRDPAFESYRVERASLAPSIEKSISPHEISHIDFLLFHLNSVICRVRAFIHELLPGKNDVIVDLNCS